MVFEKITMVPIVRVLRKYNTHVLYLIIFDENIKSTIFKVLGSVFNCIMEKYLCVDSMCLKRSKFSLTHKEYEAKKSMILKVLLL